MQVSIFLLLALSLSANAGPKYGPMAERLSRSHQYVRSHDAPDFWALLPYYLPQQNARACSLASATMAINGLRARRDLSADDELVTQSGLLKKSGNAEWSTAVGAMGRGLTLDQLAAFTKQAAEAYGITPISAEVVRFEDASAKELARLRKILEANEKSSDDLILLNFLQSHYTGDLEGAVGHIAPLGAYDSKTKRILVLDPDRELYEPYWITDETALSGMLTRDPTSGKNRGLVWLKTGIKN